MPNYKHQLANNWLKFFWAPSSGGKSKCKVESGPPTGAQQSGAEAGKKTVCNHEIFSHSGNMKSHLKLVHGITEDCAIVKEKQQAAQTQSQSRLNFQKNKFNQLELEALACCEAFRPFNWVEHAFFRMAFNPVIRTAETLQEQVEQLAFRLREEAIQALRGKPCTLCFDAGTVWKRYIVFAVRAPNIRPIVLGAIHDAEFNVDYWQFKELGIEPAVVPDLDKKRGELSAENVAKVLHNFSDDFKRRQISLVATVADNASNMQADDCHIPGVLSLRCTPHVINLLAKSTISGCFIKDLVDEIQSLQVNVPKVVPTRWNAELRLLLWAFKHFNALMRVAPTWTIRKKDEIGLAIKLLKPFMWSTMFCQKMDASLFDTLVAHSILHNFFSIIGQSRPDTPTADFARSYSNAERVGERETYWITPAIILLCFFAPNVHRMKFSYETYDFVREIVAELRHLAYGQCGKESASDTVELNFYQFKQTPPPLLDQDEITKEDYVKYWTELLPIYPRLALIILFVLDAVPTEADVERMFSLLKFGIPRYRTTLEARHVSNQLLVKSVIDFANVEISTKYFEDGSDSGSDEEVEERQAAAQVLPQPKPNRPTHEVESLEDFAHRELHVDVEDEPAEPARQATGAAAAAAQPEPTPIQHETFLRKRVVSRAALEALLSQEERLRVHIKKPLPPGRVTRGADHRCGTCEKPFGTHRDGISTQCSICKRYHVFSCVGLAPHQKEQIDNMETWKCPHCLYGQLGQKKGRAEV